MFECGYLSHGMYVSIGLNGDIYPCCFASDGQASIKDKNDSDDILNGRFITKLRRQALDNKVPDICSGCIKREQITGTSPRIKNNHFIDNTVKEVISEEDVRYIQVRLSNVCNFQCTICGGGSSHLIAKEEGMKNPLQIIEDDVYNQLKKRLPKMSDLQTIVFAGGEPFYNTKKLIELLDYIPKTVKRIAMHTNGSVYDKQLLDKLYEFNFPIIDFSFDGTGRFFEYQRRNGKWDEVLNNLKKIKENYPRIWIQGNNTITNTTFINLPDFLREMKPYFNKIDNVFIQNPVYYQINTVKPEVLNKIKSQIEDDIIVKNIDYALNNPAPSNVIRAFWNRVSYLNSKQHNIYDYIPEIRDIVRISN